MCLFGRYKFSVVFWGGFLTHVVFVCFFFFFLPGLLQLCLHLAKSCLCMSVVCSKRWRISFGSPCPVKRMFWIVSSPQNVWTIYSITDIQCLVCPVALCLVMVLLCFHESKNSINVSELCVCNMRNCNAILQVLRGIVLCLFRMAPTWLSYYSIKATR